VGLGRAGAIGKVRIEELQPTNGETFTVVLTDRRGLLSADRSASGGGGTITGDGTTSLTITGTLVEIDADLMTLTDKDPTAGSDTITINARGSFDNEATPHSIAVTVDGRPTIEAPAQSVLNYASPTGGAINGVSIGELPTSSGEIFTVVLSDGHGVLSATGGTASNGGKTLTITGTLIQVDADLETLTDDESAASDTITINASDSFGNTAPPKSIAVTVNPGPAVSAADLTLSPRGGSTAGGRIDATCDHRFRSFARDWTTQGFSVSADPIGFGSPSSLMHELGLTLAH
jgi:hypothetical protein